MGLYFALGLGLATLVIPGYSTVIVPSASAWTNLNKTVNGRLYAGFPWSKPCFSVFNGQQQSPDLAECQDVQQVYFNHSGAFLLCIKIIIWNTDNEF